MLSSLARYLEPLPDEEGELFLTQIQALFQSDFIAKQQVPDQEGGESADSDELVYDQLISEEQPQDRDRDADPDPAGDVDGGVRTTEKTSETNSPTVLHLGSVLSTEHDYLL